MYDLKSPNLGLGIFHAVYPVLRWSVQCDDSVKDFHLWAIFNPHQHLDPNKLHHISSPGFILYLVLVSGCGDLELCNALHCFGQFEAGHDSNFKQQKYLQQLSLQKMQKLESSNPHMLGTISLPSRHTKKGCFFSLSRIKYDQTPFLPTTGKTLCSNAQYHCIHS